MNHYVCTGTCGGVSDKSGVCQAENCPRHNMPLTECACADNKHANASRPAEPPKWGSLRERKCVPCEGGMPPLDHDAIERLRPEIDPAWDIIGERRIRREFKFSNFKEAVDFVDKVAALAESEKHHPTIEVDFDKVALELWTHAIGGLSENDFILAAKIDALA